VVIDDMRILDSRKEAGMEEYVPFVKPESAPVAKAASDVPVDAVSADEAKPAVKEESNKEEKKTEKSEPEEVDLDDLPF